MAVPIRFEADMSAVRKAIDDIVNEAKNRTVSVPVSTPGFSPGAPGTTGGIPNASAVFAGSQHLFAGNLGSVGGFGGFSSFGGGAAFNSFGGGGGGGGGGGAGGAGGGGGAGGAGGNAFATAIAQAFAAGAAAVNNNSNVVNNYNYGRGGGGGGGGGRSLGFSAAGLARYVGAGFLAREAFRVSSEVGDYIGQRALAGGQPLGEYKAEDRLRSVIEGIPILGGAASVLADPLGIQRYNAAASIQSAQATDQKTQLMASFGIVSRAAGRAAELSGVHQPAQRALRQLDLDFQAATQTDEYTGRGARARADEDAVTALRATQRARGHFFEDYSSNWKQYQAARGVAEEKEVADLRENQRVARNNALSPYRRALDIAHTNAANEIIRSEGFRVEGIVDTAQTEIAAARFQARNDPHAAERTLLVGANRAAVRAAVERRENDYTIGTIREEGAAKLAAFDADYARTVGYAISDARGNAVVLRAVAARDPLGAQLAQIDNRMNAELRNPLVANNFALREQTKANFLQESLNATAAYNRELGFDIQAITASTGVTNALLARKPLDAQILSIEARRNNAINRDARATPGSAIRGAYEDEATAQIAEAKQQNADTKRYRRDELKAEGGELEFDIAFRPGAGRAFRVAANAKNDAQKLRDQDDAGNARLLIQNAILQEKSLRSKVLQSFDATEVDATRTAFGGPRAGEDSTEILKQIATEMKGLRQDISGGVGVGP